MAFRPRQKLGKYRIVRRLASGGFAEIYKARDTVEGISVALKVPHAHLVRAHTLEEFKREARVVARLDDPHILALKTAGHVDGHFVIVYPLGRETLHDRLKRRPSLSARLRYAEHLLLALSHAHGQRVIHCDVKPENLLIFPGDRLRLMDFGIAKVALSTLPASGSGTVGYVAPEQALGRPSVRSDVFSAGLILFRMFSGVLPVWPYDWPPRGIATLRRNLSPAMVELVRKAIEVDERKRWRDAVHMLAAFQRLRPRALAAADRRRRASPRRRDWKEVRSKEFVAVFGRSLGATSACRRCGGGVAQAMVGCPWCGAPRARAPDPGAFPAHCARCRRGVKLDWRFCPWCWGGAIGPVDQRSFSDRRYTARCTAGGCGGQLMPFMRYCPWCHAKVRRAWVLPGSKARCPDCSWGVAAEYWSHCPWCAAALEPGTHRGQ